MYFVTEEDSFKQGPTWESPFFCKGVVRVSKEKSAPTPQSGVPKAVWAIPKLWSQCT